MPDNTSEDIVETSTQWGLITPDGETHWDDYEFDGCYYALDPTTPVYKGLGYLVAKLREFALENNLGADLLDRYQLVSREVVTVTKPASLYGPLSNYAE